VTVVRTLFFFLLLINVGLCSGETGVQKNSCTHTVLTKETLWSIGKKYGVSPVAIQEANGLSSTVIRAGQLLRIPSAQAPLNVPIAVAQTGASSPKPNAASDAVVEIPRAIFVAPPKETEVSRHEKIQARFTEEIRKVSARGVAYNQSWRPPGEKENWVMDCSNTTRYLYKKAVGISLDRTASGQYYELSQKKMVWRVPVSGGSLDIAYLKKHLRPGDLLFWENTYKPKRQPPVTHVMVFLGNNSRGEWVMAGSQVGNRGEWHKSSGGPDIYPFEPAKISGGFRTFFGLGSRVDGRFVAFGRHLL